MSFIWSEYLVVSWIVSIEWLIDWCRLCVSFNWLGHLSPATLWFMIGIFGLIFRDGGFILAWIVILSVYGADTIAECRSQVIDLSLSALISWFMKSIIGFLNNSNLHAIISIFTIYNESKFYFGVSEEIYYNVVAHWSTFLISCSHSITRLISFAKTLQIRDQFFLFMDPGPFMDRSIGWMIDELMPVGCWFKLAEWPVAKFIVPDWGI
jgi:hypothetical protein